MDPAWIGVIGTLSGGVLVGVLAIVARLSELRWQRRQELRIHHRAKIEELHLQLTEFRVSSLAFATEVARIQQKIYIDENECIENVRDAVNAYYLPLGKVTSLQGLHAPELADQFDAFLSACSALPLIASEYLDGTVVHQQFIESTHHVNDTCTVLVRLVEQRHSEIMVIIK